METRVEEKFSHFFNFWVSQLEDLVKELLHASTNNAIEEPHLHTLVSKLTSHFKLYYTIKWAHAHHHVLAFFSPSWLTPLEFAYTWVTDWKPSMAFKLISQNSHDSLYTLSPDQLLQIEQLRRKIKSLEERVNRDMERQQMVMGDRHMVELSKLETRRRNGQAIVHSHVDGLVDVAIKALLLGLERTMKAADCVRLKTLKEILEVLTPLQCVHFLASFSQIQIHLRQLGNQKVADALKNTTTTSVSLSIH